MDKLKGRRALITGGAKRVGRAITTALSNEGVEVVIHYNRSDREAIELRSAIEKGGGKAWTVREEFTDMDSADRLMRSVNEMAGPVDILVNSASSFPERLQREPLKNEFESMMNINAAIPWRLAHLFSQQTAGGDIINLLDTRMSLIAIMS
ncbi:MAG: SDR family NAD(P)-dependent oxidoreductase [Candidatus Thermoplasmatota archaeon]|nr:SDR family NAD(P)-dependent oxidoreductase [Candidatus Thermoplasmatota archaeon]